MSSIRIAPGVRVCQYYIRRENSSLRFHWCIVTKRDGRVRVKPIGLDLEHALFVARQAGSLKAQPFKGTPTVAQVLDAWLAQKIAGRTPKTLASIEGWIRLHLKPALGHLPVTELTDAVLWQYVEQKIEAEEKSPALVRNSLTQLRAACNALHHWELAPFRGWQRPPEPQWINPCRRISKAITGCFEVYGDREGERDAYTADELRILLDEAFKVPGPIYVILRLAFATGMRRGEIVALRWSWIDLGGGVIRLPRTATKGSKARTVFLSDGCRKMLQTLSWGATGGRERVFPDIDGSWVYKRWCKVRDAAVERGARRGVFHELRHSFVSLSRSQGLPDAVLQSHTGQTSSIQARYSHLHPDHRPDLGAFDELVAGGDWPVTGDRDG